MSDRRAHRSFPIENLYDLLADLLARSGGKEACRTIELRRSTSSFADAHFFFRDNHWLTSPTGLGFLDTLANHPDIARIQVEEAKVSVRLTDELIAFLGKQLETGQLAGLETADLLDGSAFVVGFIDPNTTKPLHVGHLRNIVVGSGLAAALRAAGARVLRHCYVGDIGRNVCEAIAGLVRFHYGEDPRLQGLKPDHFVGRCYAEYVRTYYRKRTNGTIEDSIVREVDSPGDFADDLMRRWLAGDPCVRRLWQQIRSWVLEGQRATLKRLGVTVDRWDYESDTIDEAKALVDEGLRKGILSLDEEERVCYPGDPARFSQLILVRRDGFPTEHARLLALYTRLLRELKEWHENCIYLGVTGLEWRSANALQIELMDRLRPSPIQEILVWHGMVTLEGSKMKSSGGEAILIDDLLDRLAGSTLTKNLVAASKGALKPETIADIVARGYFLSRQPLKEVDFCWDRLMREARNPGWTLARAWCCVTPDSEPVGPDPDPEQGAYRSTVIMSQDFRRNLRHATTILELSGLTSYALHYCRQLLDTPSDPRVHRVGRTVLNRALTTLGMLQAIDDVTFGRNRRKDHVSGN